MRIVRPARDITVPVERGRGSITLRRGAEYVMHDVEAASGSRASVWRSVRALPPRPKHWYPDAPRRTDAERRGTGVSDAERRGTSLRLIVPFIGGLGDAVSMLPLLAAIRVHQARESCVHIEVAATSGPAGVFELSRAVDRVVAYPLQLRQWTRYDCYVSMEAVHATGQQPGRPLPDVFAAALGVELGEYAFELDEPRFVAPAMEFAPSPRIAIAVGELDSLRSYPLPLLRDVIDRLVSDGVHIALLGERDERMIIGPRESLADMRGMTATVRELAGVLRTMDAVIAHDSFILHLAGAMGVPTLGLFAPTSQRHGEPYASLRPLVSTRECAPCHAARGECPRAHDRCLAWDERAVAPDSVIEQLATMGLIAAA